jgi:CspA family cold shock protein
MNFYFIRLLKGKFDNFFLNTNVIDFPMPTGIIVFFLPEKGFGYVRDTETQAEYVVRQKHLLAPVRDKEEVTFEIAENKQGQYAIRVQPLLPKK